MGMTYAYVLLEEERRQERGSGQDWKEGYVYVHSLIQDHAIRPFQVWDDCNECSLDSARLYCDYIRMPLNVYFMGRFSGWA